MMSELLGSEKHLEICCACNHGRTPCSEYRRNYEKSADMAGVEHTDGQSSAVDSRTGIEKKARETLRLRKALQAFVDFHFVDVDGESCRYCGTKIRGSLLTHTNDCIFANARELLEQP